MNPLDNPSYLLPPLLAALFSGLLLFLVVRRVRDSPAHLYFSVFLLAMGLWAYLIFIMRSSPDTQHALFWERLVLPVMLASSPSFYFFTLAYTRRGRNRFLPLLTFLYLSGIAFLAASDLLVERMEVRSYGYAPIFTLPFYPIALGAYVWVVVGMVNFYRAWHASRVYEERNRLLYILTGTSFIVIGTVLDIMPFIYPTGILGNLAFSTVTTVAMRKYHLMDISLVLRKGLAYLMMSTLIAVPYVSIILLATYVIQIGQVHPLVYALLLLILALFLQPLWSQMQRLVDQLFFRRRWDHFRILEEFSQRTRSISDLERLASDLVRFIQAAAQAEGVSLLLPTAGGDFAAVASSGKRGLGSLLLTPISPVALWLAKEGKPLERYQISLSPQLQALSNRDREMIEAAGASLLIPLRVRERLTGVLVLGDKRSESPYGQEELRLLNMVASQMAILVEDARIFALEKARVAELEELHQMKSDFFLAVAHHLKTPVTAIKASVEMLAELNNGDQSPTQRRLASAMLRSSQSLEKAISEILELLRIRAAAVEVQPEPTDVPELVREIAGLLQPALQQKGQTLILELPSSFPQAHLDRRRFEQILVNLLNNAYKFTPSGGKIEVALKQNEGFLVVEVRDTGPGIAEADQEHIFEPFYLGRDRDTEPGSSGLGLTITRSLVEFLGGKIWLRSKVGEGSTFGFSLPMEPPPQRRQYVSLSAP